MTLRCIDSHCHLQDPALAADADTYYQEAVDAGVAVIIPGYSRASSAEAVGLAERWPLAWALVGVHPHESEEAQGDWLQALERWLCHPRVLGVGEIGLDYYRDLAPRDRQREAFAAQLDLARRFGVPVSVHARDAWADILALLRESTWQRGVLHCFTGGLDEARALVEWGFFLSFAGPITFRKAEALRAVVKWAPLDRILVETDAPYMSPEPHRGHLNRPKWVLDTAAMVATVKGLPERKVLEQLVSNTQSLFWGPDGTVSLDMEGVGSPRSET